MVDGFERNEKKEEARAGVVDDVDAMGEWLIDGGGILDKSLPLVVVVPDQVGVVTSSVARTSARARSQSSDHHGCKIPLEVAHSSRTASAVLFSHCNSFQAFVDFLSKV